MIKENILLFSLITLTLALGISAHAAEATKWSVGSWWIIQSQTYNSGGIMTGEENIGWEKKQVWRFEVTGTQQINNDAYFVVLIRPVEGNPCPYVFRFWYRKADLFVGRYEVLYPETTDGIISEATKTVRKEFTGNTPTPFATLYFPNLPANISPLLHDPDTAPAPVPAAARVASRTALPESANQPGVPVQHVEILDDNVAPPMPVMPHSRMMRSRSTGSPTRLFKIQYGPTVEKQYWNPQLPWSYYSESDETSSLKRRSWLVDYGN